MISLMRSPYFLSRVRGSSLIATVRLTSVISPLYTLAKVPFPKKSDYLKEYAPSLNDAIINNLLLI